MEVCWHCQWKQWLPSQFCRIQCRRFLKFDANLRHIFINHPNLWKGSFKDFDGLNQVLSAMSTVCVLSVPPTVMWAGWLGGHSDTKDNVCEEVVLGQWRIHVDPCGEVFPTVTEKCPVKELESPIGPKSGKDWVQLFIVSYTLQFAVQSRSLSRNPIKINSSYQYSR